MNESIARKREDDENASRATLILAIVAPFGALCLMASPLLFDALKHAVGF
jgi:hypothetical protein